MACSGSESVAFVARRVLAGAVAVIGMLAGCTIPRPGQIAAGMDEPQVVALMGAPTSRYSMPAGMTRLEFARGPAGRETWMVDLDAGGHVTGVEQVLDGWHFLAVKDGTPREALLRALGRPGWVRGEYGDRETWYWRYPSTQCLVAAATLSPQGQVIGGVAQMPDPDCELPAR